VTTAHGPRLRVDCKATVRIGDVSRGGLTRGDAHAGGHALGWTEQDMPCGIVDEGSGQWHIPFGSSYKTRDFIVDALEAWWAALDETAQGAMTQLQITRDHGPASRGRRTPFVQRIVAFGDAIGQPMQLLSDPPYHSTYHPIERCWGILALHWNGTKLMNVETMVEWAKSMTWKRMHPLVALNRKIYQKGVTLSKKAMRAVEARLERHPELPQWDILIHQAST